jgi:hypothetical protein
LTDPADNNGPADEHAAHAISAPEKQKPETGSHETGAGQAEKRKHTLLEKIAFGVATLAALGTGYQAYIASDTEERSLRAYVFPEYAGTFSGVVRDQTPTLHFNIIDRGQTPATDVKLFGVMKIAPLPLPKGYDFSADETTQGQVFSIYPNAATPLTGGIHAIKPITAEELIEVTSVDSKRRLFGYGHLTYKDVFKVERHTTFCFWMDPTTIELNAAKEINKVLWAFCDRHIDFD